MGDKHFDELNQAITACRRCPRLVAWLAQTASQPRASYRGQVYHAAPVPNFGDPRARILLVGLAPGAHGANRTGRMFTGDRSGDFLYAALHRVGLANQPTSTHRDDGLQLSDVAVTAAGHCAPPANKPLPEELQQCQPWLERTFDVLPSVRVVVALGKIAFDAVLRLARQRGASFKARPSFGHGSESWFTMDDRRRLLLGCYHPSQQNTFTGKLTPAMLEAVLRRARKAAEDPISAEPAPRSRPR